jgi:hypothetical protein
MSSNHLSALLLSPFALVLLLSSLGLGPESSPATGPQTRGSQAPRGTDTPSASVFTQRAEAWRLTAPVTPLTSVQTDFATRFAAAMMKDPRVRTSSHRVPNSPPPTAPTSVWVCGDWETLVQGRGQARSCEWRQMPQIPPSKPDPSVPTNSPVVRQPSRRAGA